MAVNHNVFFLQFFLVMVIKQMWWLLNDPIVHYIVYLCQKPKVSSFGGKPVIKWDAAVIAAVLLSS